MNGNEGPAGVTCTGRVLHQDRLRSAGRLRDGRHLLHAPAFTGIVFDSELLTAVQLHHDAGFHRALEQQAETRVARLGRTKTYTERVRDYLLDGKTNAGDDLEAVARALGLSVRTLRRRLQEEGTNYTAIASAAFVSLAKRFLVDEARSVDETAYAMGYSTPSAFQKAFKRWTGTTPKTFRQRHDRTVLS